ncbi:hypothetical protein OKIT_1086 [Oenococcus kitaharae DSM 17330]|uniref:Uncharacterized protein n=1 Tax=Oenococcus kitaharae DSM 17330 TaxID=1045004 RepID=G9WI67_9LACO|nr:hypothetical protein OKIT_1086 [Oenococcus kitaharae DSM 17330]
MSSFFSINLDRFKQPNAHSRADLNILQPLHAKVKGILQKNKKPAFQRVKRLKNGDRKGVIW